MKLLLITVSGGLVLFFLVITFFKKTPPKASPPIANKSALETISKPNTPTLPIFVSELRNRKYPPSKIIIEETLTPGTNYERFIASYSSDDLKIFGLYTVPKGSPPTGGWPAIVFVHGHLDAKSYTPTARYVAYQDGFARNGFITFKPDLRGHGQSDGQTVNANFEDGYFVDTLNLVAAFKESEIINPNRIGIWGHSMGGGIALHDIVASKDIKAAVIWAGVVGNYEDLLERYRKRSDWLKRQSESSLVHTFFDKYGSPSANPKFWDQIDPYAFLKDVSTPVQLHHGTADTSVPLEFSEHLNNALKKAGKTVEFYQYEGSDHNIAQEFSLAMQRSIAFFKKHL